MKGGVQNNISKPVVPQNRIFDKSHVILKDIKNPHPAFLPSNDQSLRVEAGAKVSDAVLSFIMAIIS